MSAAKRVAHAAETVRARWERQVSTDPQTEAAQALEDTGQLLDPEVAAELVAFRKARELAAEVAKYGAFPVPVGSQPQALSAVQGMALAELIGDVKPANPKLLRAFGEAVRDCREHEHPKSSEDFHCLNLAAWMGERAGLILRRLLDVEAENARLRSQVAELNESVSSAAEELRARQSCLCPPADQPGPHQVGCPQAEVPELGGPR